MRPQEFPSIEAERDALRRENSELRTIAQMLVDRLYGKKSERSEKPPDKAKPPKKREPEKTEDSGHGRAAFPEQHPRETTTTDVPESERVCSTCQAPMKPIGEGDVLERGDISSIRITIQRHVRKKYGCPHGHEVKVGAPPPPGLVDRAKWTTATYAYLAVCKFGDHIPFDRLEGILKRQGIHLPKSTMGDMVQVVAEKGRLILAQCQKEMLGVLSGSLQLFRNFGMFPGRIPSQHRRSRSSEWALSYPVC